MTNKKKSTILPPTVLLVVESFIEKLLDDPGIPNDAAKRFEELLLEGSVPKPEEIYTSLFNPPKDIEK